MAEVLNFFSLSNIILILGQIPWYMILIIAFIVTFIENIFPPSPSDIILMFMGSMIAIGSIGFIPLLISSTLGSTLGFLVMYWLGKEFGDKMIDSDKLPFITKSNLEKPRIWFNKYGYYLIIANRFLSGTRAVISFFAGLSKLPIKKTTLLSTISALIWNFILLYLGKLIGGNLEILNVYLNIYGKIILEFSILIIVILIIRYFYLKKYSLK
ncbi:MAG: DedA family protein [Candidatus Kapabacteria bacterium]|nr:DedA family protein [Candidatus Kapabacteria bacterium]